MDYAAAIWKNLEQMRSIRPLVLNVTNNVVTNLTANVLLSLGASPAMSHAAPDAAALAGLSGAVVLNMGTPQAAYVESMLAAGKAANDKGAPVVFDPVACGATAYRAEVAAKVLDQVKLAVVRGNASEIMALAGAGGSGKGVDSLDEASSAVDGATRLAMRLGCTVCVSGAEDFITDGARVVGVAGGDPMMTLVTGLGCAATAVIGAFAALRGDAFDAALSGMAVMGVAGEMALAGARGPGSYAVNFLDSLYNLSHAYLQARLKVRTA